MKLLTSTLIGLLFTVIIGIVLFIIGWLFIYHTETAIWIVVLITWIYFAIVAQNV